MDYQSFSMISDVVLTFFKTLAEFGAGVAVIYGFAKFTWPKIKPYWDDYVYYHTNAVHVIRDIEKAFGKEAGAAIKEVLLQKNNSIGFACARLDVIENAVGMGIFISDASGKFILANKTLCNIFDSQSEDMMEFGWIGKLEASDREKCYNNWMFSISHNIPYSDTYSITSNGKQVVVSAEAEPSMIGQTVIGWVGVVKKINI